MKTYVEALKSIILKHYNCFTQESGHGVSMDVCVKFQHTAVLCIFKAFAFTLFSYLNIHQQKVLLLLNELLLHNLYLAFLSVVVSCSCSLHITGSLTRFFRSMFFPWQTTQPFGEFVLWQQICSTLFPGSVLKGWDRISKGYGAKLGELHRSVISLY